MHTAAGPHDEPTVALGRAIAKAVSWGMDNEQRERFLAETDADWQLMYADLGGTAVVGRAIRGIPAAILSRMQDHEITAIPTGIALGLVAVFGVAAGLLDRSYPPDLRFFILTTAIAFALGARMLIASPRTLVLRNVRWPSLALAVGATGMALTMPTAGDWAYAAPVPETPLIDAAMVLGFCLVGVGGVVTLLVSLRNGPMRAFWAGMYAVIAGFVVFGTAQIMWGLTAAPIDLAITATAVGIGLGNYSLAHVMPRLRKLEIV